MEVSEEWLDNKLLRLEKKVSDLSHALSGVNPDDVYRASETHKALTELLEPFGELRKASAIIGMLNHMVDKMAMIEGELREIRRITGTEASMELEASQQAHLVAALRAAGKTDSEVEAILAQRG